MPLSENEQRILSEIEAQLYESDPALAREVGSTTVYTHSLRNMKWAVVGFFVGVAVMVVTLSTSFWVSFLGFLIMLGSAVFAERNARRMGKAGIEQVTRSLRGSGLRDYFAESGDRLRRRGDDDDNSPA